MLGVPTEIVSEATLLIETDQGVVCWVVKEGLSMIGGMHRNFQAIIINPETGKTLAKVPLANKMAITDQIKPMLVGDQVLVFNPKTFDLDFYHPYTGVITESLYTYLETQPEFSKGIGKIAPAGFHENILFKVTTKDNQDYWFSPYDKKISKKNNELLRQKTQEVFVWTIRRESNVEFPVLSKVMTIPYNSNPGFRVGSAGEEILRLDIPFIQPKIIYGNQDFFIVFHQSEVGKDAKPVLTAFDKQGKVIWKNKKLQSKALVETRFEGRKPDIKAAIYHQNTIFIHSQAEEEAILGIDMKNGEIISVYKLLY